ncbi:MAG: hypothetical protein EPN38_08535 [Rhodanobacteraceae bacterium]|nr:MAG: hypothetical protein EPN38_08535 [Rhodanobacteraceae bacterium]
MTYHLDTSTPALVVNLRRQLSRGYGAAIAKHVKSIAQGCDDVERLRALVGLLADHITDPPRRKRGAPRKKSSPVRTREVDGKITATIDLDAIIPKTKAEQRQELHRLVLRLRVLDEVERVLKRKDVSLTGAFMEAARALNITEAQARKAYYGHDSRQS